MTRGSKAPRTLAEQIADLDDPTPRDFDPEDHQPFGQNHEEDSGDGELEGDLGGREHYESVGKGNFGKAEELSLGKQYEGLNVSRDALEDDSNEDPFGKGASDLEDSEKDGASFDDPDDVDLEAANNYVEDEDIDSDEAFGKSDTELRKKFKFLDSSERGRTNGGGSPSPADEDMESAEEDEGGDDIEEEAQSALANRVDLQMENGGPIEDGGDGTDSNADSDISEKDQYNESEDPGPADDRATLRKLMASDQKTVAATIGQAAKLDAAKGQAVKRQRSTFDALLNTPIKLQKSVVAMNLLPTTEKEVPGGNQAIKAAEDAAMVLWSNVEDLRQQLASEASQSAKTGQKRKRPVPSATSEDIWKHMQSVELTFLPHRRSVLDKWSSKVRAATASDSRGKLLPKSDAQGITALLDAQLTTEAEKLVQRTKIPRSAAPAQSQLQNKADAAAPEKTSIFDDSDFYQLLLRELVEQRMDSFSTQGGAVPIATSLRDMRVKKNVDTKASKGRKMRYTVHEKLQNFMAPEDRGTWTEKARDEFFGSLLGDRADKAFREEEEESGEEHETEALRLFRT